MGRPVNPRHTLYRPKWYRRRMPIFWWLREPAFAKFIGRELTSVFVAYSAILLMIQIWALARGEATYERLSSVLQLPAVVVLHGAVLLVVVFHTVTWLNLTPKALVLRARGRRVPDAVVLGAHYLAWVVISGLLIWLLQARS